MKSRIYIYLCMVSAVLLTLIPHVAIADDIQPVIIDFFFESGCPECARVNAHIIPQLKERYEGFYVLHRHDVAVKTNYLTLVTYQEQLGVVENEPVSMVVDYQYAFNGFDAIKAGMFDRIDRAIADRMSPDWREPEPISPVGPQQEGSIVNTRLDGFTLGAVILAGLSDGINPCAIGTLVFFMSLLTVSRIRGRNMAVIGACFCLASFLTYLAIGLGLLHGLRSLEVFPRFQTVLDYVFAGVLAVLAFLSFFDAWRYSRSGKASDVVVQLPKSIKKLSHWVMRKGLGLGSLTMAGIVIGIGVTALETVCTGQIYVPTLAMVIKSGGGSSGKAWRYLLAYNIMFILPLVIVFVLTLFGLQLKSLQSWSKKNVILSKLFLGFLFLALMMLMWFL